MAIGRSDEDKGFARRPALPERMSQDRTPPWLTGLLAGGLLAALAWGALELYSLNARLAAVQTRTIALETQIDSVRAGLAQVSRRQDDIFKLFVVQDRKLEKIVELLDRRLPPAAR